MPHHLEGCHRRYIVRQSRTPVAVPPGLVTKVRHCTRSARCSGKTEGNVFRTSTYDHSTSLAEHPYHIIWKVAVAVTSYGSRERHSLYWRERQKYDIVHVQHTVPEKRTGMFSVRLHVMTVRLPWICWPVTVWLSPRRALVTPSKLRWTTMWQLLCLHL